MRITLSTGTPAEIARPSTGEPVGGLVLWPDVLGLRPLFEQHTQRLADELGRVVVTPEIYPGLDAMPVPERLAYAVNFNDSDKLADSVAAADETGFDRVAAMGFCMGGMFAMKALASERFDRAVAFYGMIRVPEHWRGPGDGTGQGDAIDVVAARAASAEGLRLLCIFGTEDSWCPLEQIDEIEAVGASVVRYEGADHGWAQDPARDNYRASDTADAFRRTEAFLLAD